MAKVYRKSLLAMMVIAAIPVLAATDNTIYVTTTVDEDGENMNACSLREAVTAATNNKAYGGCIAGQYNPADKIQLKEGIYTLNKTLKITSAMVINGANAFTYDRTEPVNNSEAAREQLKTTIKGNSTFTLIDSAASKNSVTLNSVILSKGAGINGGAIRSGGVITLNRVYILDSTASQSGGAIYLEGADSGLTATDSLFWGNTSPRGAVVGMSCIDNLVWTPRSIVFDRSAILKNGSSTTSSIIDYCGTPTGSITASTIAQNTVNLSSGSTVIKYKHDPIGKLDVLHPSSSIFLKSNTIVQNTGWSTLLYDNVGTLTLDHNVIAYNAGGKSCRYWPYAVSGQVLKAGLSTTKVTSLYDAVLVDKSKTGAPDNTEGACYLPEPATTTTDGTTTVDDKSAVVDLKGINFSTLLYGLPAFSSDDFNSTQLENYGFLPAYIPKPGVDKKTLINAGDIGNCTAFDQRGLTRSMALAGTDTTNLRGNKCDIGSIEIANLRAVDLNNVSNTSFVADTAGLETKIKNVEDLLKSPDMDPVRIVQYQNALRDLKAELDAFKIVDQNANSTVSQRYRQVYASIFPGSIEEELDTLASDSKSANVKYAKFLNDKNEFNSAEYEVKVKALGRGPQTDGTLGQDPITLPGFNTAEAANIRCVWNEKLKQVMLSRIDKEIDPATGKLAPVGVTTPAGNNEYCAYSIILKANPLIKTTGYVQARIVNIQPIAKDDKYTLKYGSDQPIVIDILANDNDDGDGVSTVPGYPYNKTPFYQDKATNRYANIKITSGTPTSTGVDTGLGVLSFEYVQPCPNNSNTTEEVTCYGGKATYKAKNVFSPFNDSFKYKVLDLDKSESSEATVTIINTATTDDDTRGNSGGSTGSGGSSGGGSIGILAITGLGLLAVMRRKLFK